MACGFSLQSKFSNYKGRKVTLPNVAVKRLKKLSCMEL